MNITINLISLVVQILLVFVIPAFNDSISVDNGLHLFLLLIISYFFGVYLMSYLRNRFQIKGSIFDFMGTYIVLVLFAPVLFFLKFVQPSVLLFVFLIIVCFVAIFKRGQIKVENNITNLIPVFVPTVLSFFLFFNWKEALSITPVMYSNYFQDFYWFTAMTASIKDFDFSNCNFEEGTGVYHHVLGLFPGAVISAITKINTHTALWSISMPLAIFSAFCTLQVFIDQINEKMSVFDRNFLAVVFVFLFPLNPNALIKGHLDEMVWFGAGHTLPLLPTWITSYIFPTILIMVLFKMKDFNFGNCIILALLILCVAWGKVTTFFVLMPMITIYFVIIDRDLFSMRLKNLYLSIIPSLIFIFFYYSNSSAKFVYEPGQIVLDNLKVDILTPLNYLKSITIGVVIILIWGNLKWVVFFSKENNSRILLLIFILCFIFCLLLESILKIQSYSKEGFLVDDSSFDILQFLRSSFIFFNFIFIIQLTWHLNIRKVFKSKGWIYFIFYLYSLVIFFIIINNRDFYLTNNKLIHRDWYASVLIDLNTRLDVKKAMISDCEYSGQFLAANDVNNWYTSIQNRHGGYTYSYSHLDRYKRLNNFLLYHSSKAYLNELKREKVVILVATPNTELYFIKLVNLGWLKKIAGTHWLYTY